MAHHIDKVVEIFKKVVGREPKSNDMNSIYSIAQQEVTEAQIEEFFSGLPKSEEYLDTLENNGVVEEMDDPTPPPEEPDDATVEEEKTEEEVVDATDEETTAPEGEGEGGEKEGKKENEDDMITKDDLKNMTVAELKPMAKDLGITGKMNKKELVDRIWKAL